MIPIAKPYLDKEEEKAVLAVIRSGMIAMGEKVQELEKKFSKKFGYKHTIATSSGTSALHTILYAEGIGEGDEVITTPFTFIATANTIQAVGASPIFVDIDPKTLNIDPSQIEQAITKRTKAIMPVHLYGYPCDMDKIEEVAKKYNLKIIEDACQAHGARYKGKFVGEWGTTAFSLYPTKNITSAEGGLITTNDDTVAEKVRLFINHGQSARYVHTDFGLNFRMTNIHAAIGIVQLGKIDKFTQKRQENAKYLRRNLENVELPPDEDGYEHVYHQFTIRVKKGRNKIIEELNDAGIGTGIHYPTPIHKQPYYKKIGYGKLSFPEAEKASKEVISLPVHPLVTKKDLGHICSTLNKLTSK